MLKMTYCFELMHIILRDCRKDIKMNKMEYTSDSLVTEIEDIGHDHQKYLITIEPIKE